MLYVDGMNGVIEHNETIQWLYSLIGSKVSQPSMHCYLNQMSALCTLRFFFYQLSYQGVSDTAVLTFYLSSSRERSYDLVQPEKVSSVVSQLSHYKNLFYNLLVD